MSSKVMHDIDGAFMLNSGEIIEYKCRIEGKYDKNKRRREVQNNIIEPPTTVSIRISSKISDYDVPYIYDSLCEANGHTTYATRISMDNVADKEERVKMMHEQLQSYVYGKLHNEIEEVVKTIEKSIDVVKKANQIAMNIDNGIADVSMF